MDGNRQKADRDAHAVKSCPAPSSTKWKGAGHIQPFQAGPTFDQKMNPAYGPAPKCPRQEARAAELRNPPFPSTVLTQHPGWGAIPLIRLASLNTVPVSAPKILSCHLSSESVSPSTQQPVSPRCPATADYQQAADSGPGSQSSLPGAACTQSRAGVGVGWGLGGLSRGLGGPEQGGDPGDGAGGCTTLNPSQPPSPN